MVFGKARNSGSKCSIYMYIYMIQTQISLRKAIIMIFLKNVAMANIMVDKT